MTADSRSRAQPPDRSSPGGLAGAGPVPAAAAEPPVLDQAFESDSLYLLRSAVAAYASQAGLPPARCDDVVVAVHELAANVIRHGAGHGRLRLWHDHTALHCEVSDDGPARGDGDGQAAVRDAAGWPVDYGHGLWLVQTVSDQATWRSGADGSTVAITFTIQPPG